jgi:hypothetical protein
VGGALVGWVLLLLPITKTGINIDLWQKLQNIFMAAQGQ